MPVPAKLDQCDPPWWELMAPGEDSLKALAISKSSTVILVMWKENEKTPLTKQLRLRGRVLSLSPQIHAPVQSCEINKNLTKIKRRKAKFVLTEGRGNSLY